MLSCWTLTLVSMDAAELSTKFIGNEKYMLHTVRLEHCMIAKYGVEQG